MCPSATDSRSYRHHAIDVTVDVEGPLDCLGDICNILDKYDVIYEVCI